LEPLLVHRGMWPDHRLIDLLEIEHPIVLSPMAGFVTLELAAAVCNAGGLGSIGCGPLEPEVVAKTIHALRGLTDKPINANFFCHVPATTATDREGAWQDRLLPYYRELDIDSAISVPRIDIPPFDEARCKVVEETEPEVVSFHFGLPDSALLDRVKAAGCRIMASATTVAEARWLEMQGVDIIIAQGYEAGGHRGTFLTKISNSVSSSQPGTLALVPQVVDAVKVPVVAAGGIADGRGIAAAFALGAAGTQLGTAYLLCPEAATSQPHRDALRDADSDATLVTNVFTGRPARALSNRLALEIGPIANGLPDFPLPMGALAPLRAKAERQGNSHFTPFWLGQASALGKEMPAGELTRKLAQEAVDRLKKLSLG
jgi:nitronate monooxygenase